MNSAVGRVTAALASVHNENAVSLANLNFDFTLVKLEAPTEFQGVGNMISRRRKTTAEDGLIHKTARKLGALFASRIPSTPELHKAYGARVSEICQSEIANPRPKAMDGMFANYVGADCTSMWAAVTSGEEAIGVHLLACMLARIWHGTEATSVWDEIVTQRKLEIMNEVEGSQYPSKFDREVFAARQDISREELACWDASARSWIECADKAKEREQKQLMLMLDNINLPINSEQKLYTSVMSAWVTALAAMNTLLKGIPQQIQDGAALLGISSWHLFPDLEVLGSKPVEVNQKDGLFQSTALLTLGLQFGNRQSSNSVSWSLPLARMKYYGDPIQSQQSLGHDNSRITMKQFGFIVLGAIFESWGDYGQPTEIGLTWLSRISQLLDEEGREHFKASQAKCGLTQSEKWLIWIFEVSETLSSTSGMERQIALQLVGLGRRRMESLCPSYLRPLPLFGLSDPLVLLPLVTNKNVRLRLLRFVATKFGLENSTHIIRYRVLPNGPTYEYASVRPLNSNDAHKAGFKTDIPKLESAVGKHIRWLAIFKAQQTPQIRAWGNAGCHCVTCCSPDCPCLQTGRECSSTCHPGAINRLEDCGKKNWAHIQLLASRAAHYESLGECCLPVCEANRYVSKENGKQVIQPLRIRKSRGGSFGEGVTMVSREIAGTPFANLDDLDLVIGDLETSGIYKFVGAHSSPESIPVSTTSYIEPKLMDKVLTLGDILSEPVIDWFETFRMLPFQGARMRDPGATEGTDFSRGPLVVGNAEQPQTNSKIVISGNTAGQDSNSPLINNVADLLETGCTYDTYRDFLIACAFAAEVYKDIPSATISTKIASQSLWKSKWFSQRTSLENREATAKRGLGTYAQMFACIAMFDTGTYDFDPAGLNTVFALSSGNSIYTAAPLMDDPAESPDSRIRHVVGNVGRPGLSFLIPPTEAKTRKVENERWMHINHVPFDGKFEDCFLPTTIHLGFTEYSLPLHQEFYAYNIIDRPASLIETLVSVHDRGRWITDLNILGAIANIHQPYSNKNYKKGVPFTGLDPKCGCQSGQNHIVNFDEVAGYKEFVAIDNWDELLEAPPGRSIVVRARGNRLARLACAVSSVASGRVTFILPTNVCMECCHKVFKAAAGSSLVTAVIS